MTNFKHLNHHQTKLLQERKRRILNHIKVFSPVDLSELNIFAHSLEPDVKYVTSTKKTRLIINQLLEEGLIDRLPVMGHMSRKILVKL